MCQGVQFMVNAIDDLFVKFTGAKCFKTANLSIIKPFKCSSFL